MENVNWIALVVASISSLMVGFVWYHEKVFGNAWMKAIGMNKDDIGKANMPVIFGLTLVFSFILAFFLNFLITGGEVHEDPQFHTFKHGMFHGILTAFMTALPMIGTNALFEQRSWKYIGINVGYWVVTLGLMGGVIGAFQ